ncbi:MAG: lysoplasmalogenase [Hydrogenophaga sp.]|uniref:lysoplasmalogenase n=1 Tax=Hydrogenophaga sp. TaxID=1904254 RepID=UPI001D569644|nr:lysoplasmalogenase [Hydrogenophaga sp.]MBX3608331.1 lysoplasmalogenase [Hydrogenophaga sp.]
MPLPPFAPLALTLICLACVVAQIAFDRSTWAFAPAARGVAKLGASSAFVAVAVVLGAAHSPYGRLVLAALALGWVGDALLLSRRKPVFLAGLVAFLIAHGLYAAAFASGPLDETALAVASLLSVAAGAGFLRWVRPHLPRALTWPVRAYVAVILLMCVAAAGHTVATGRGVVLLGALLFAVSDVAVARDRFVERTHANHLWGWPTYFAAQLLLAWSVVGMG